MRSSSTLFPVSLIATEMLGDLHDDAYLLNPGVSSDPGVRIAVSRITDPRWQAPRTPVILLHSEFNNRHQWLGTDAQGPARQLARAGFDVWLPEMRGHGRSPRNPQWTANQLSHYAHEDWPAVQRFVIEQSGAPFWVAQGLATQALAQMLLERPRQGAQVRGVVFIEPGQSARHWLQQALSRRQRWRLSRESSLSGPWGVEEEPAALISALLSTHRKHRRSADHPVYDRLRGIRSDSLVISNGNDDHVRVFSGLLGSQKRHTLLRHGATRTAAAEDGPDQVPAARLTTVAACQPPDPVLTATLLEWLQQRNPPAVQAQPEQSA